MSLKARTEKRLAQLQNKRNDLWATSTQAASDGDEKGVEQAHQQLAFTEARIEELWNLLYMH